MNTLAEVCRIMFVGVAILNVFICIAATIIVGLARPFGSVRLNAATALFIAGVAMSNMTTLYAVSRLGLDAVSPFSAVVRLLVLAGAAGIVWEAWALRDHSEWGRYPGGETDADR